MTGVLPSGNQPAAVPRKHSLVRPRAEKAGMEEAADYAGAAAASAHPATGQQAWLWVRSRAASSCLQFAEGALLAEALGKRSSHLLPHQGGCLRANLTCWFVSSDLPTTCSLSSPHSAGGARSAEFHHHGARLVPTVRRRRGEGRRRQLVESGQQTAQVATLTLVTALQGWKRRGKVGENGAVALF